MALPALEVRWALLQEGLDAFCAVSGGLEDDREVELVAQGLVEGQFDAVVHGLLGVSQADGAVGRDALGDCIDLALEIGRREVRG